MFAGYQCTFHAIALIKYILPLMQTIVRNNLDLITFKFFLVFLQLILFSDFSDRKNPGLQKDCWYMWQWWKMHLSEKWTKLWCYSKLQEWGRGSKVKTVVSWWCRCILWQCWWLHQRNCHQAGTCRTFSLTLLALLNKVFMVRMEKNLVYGPTVFFKKCFKSS